MRIKSLLRPLLASTIALCAASTAVQAQDEAPAKATAKELPTAKKIFEDHFSPVRGIPISELPGSDADPDVRHRFFARFIWNSMQTFVLTKELLEKDIKNHHVVENIAYVCIISIRPGPIGTQ